MLQCPSGKTSRAPDGSHVLSLAEFHKGMEPTSGRGLDVVV